MMREISYLNRAILFRRGNEKAFIIQPECVGLVFRNHTASHDVYCLNVSCVGGVRDHTPSGAERRSAPKALDSMSQRDLTDLMLMMRCIGVGDSAMPRSIG